MRIQSSLTSLSLTENLIFRKHQGAAVIASEPHNLPHSDNDVIQSNTVLQVPAGVGDMSVMKARLLTPASS